MNELDQPASATLLLVLDTSLSGKLSEVGLQRFGPVHKMPWYDALATDGIRLGDAEAQ